MRRPIRLALLGGTAYLLALGLQTPAAWVLHWNRDALPAAITLAGVQGSIWHPQADRIRLDPPGPARVEAGPAEVVIQPSRLLLGRLQGDVRASALGGEASARVGVAWDGGWRVGQGRATVPLENLGRADPRLDFGQSGTLVLNVQGLRGARLPAEGTVRGTIRDFRLPGLGPEGAYGTYRAEGSFSGPGRLRGKVTTTKARVLAVKGRFRADLEAGTARFTGEAWTPDGAPPAARQVLALFGPVRDGRARIQWQGRLR